MYPDGSSIPAALGPLWLVIALVSIALSIGIYIWTAVALGAVFGKLGIERWKAWIPVYNSVIFLGLGGLSGWLLLLLLIPGFGGIFVYVAIVTAAHRIGAMFGYGGGMTVLAALLLPVWASVLGFGAARPVHQVAPRPVREPREQAPDEFAAFTAAFPAAAVDGDEFSGRRSVPTPSAWIPPAPPLPGAAPAEPAPPAPAAQSWSEPPAFQPYTAPAAPAPVPDPYAAPTVDPYAAPATDPYAAPAAADPYAAPVGDPFAAPAAADPYAAPAAPPSPPVDNPYAAPAAPTPSADPFAAPAGDPYAAPAAEPAAPAPVMSWWQPAVVDEEEEAAAPAAAAAPAPAAADPAPASAVPTAAEESSDAAFVPPPVPPVLRDSFLPESDAFPEASGEVSAVVGAPVAGQPRAAAASVAASRPGVGDLVEDTVIASRRRPKWALVLPDGNPLELTGDTVVLGRRPVPVHSAPGAQLVTVVDDTRTVSKTHALLRRRADAWMIGDLGSTNGVVVLVDGAEVEVAPGADQEVTERFLLGDAELRIARTDS
ncbi:DUF5684 domain-containing protein [Microbacterium sp. NPDC089189]|uniref:DUF5684 domain-containing protein n=1 Tax=Microbacterium sp. NPDC089189 TaxID=3154972 RepID=UPI0034398D1D